MRERRKAPRYPLGVAGKFHASRGSVAREVVVEIISTLGCALANFEAPIAAKKCELYFDWEDVVIGVQAEVVGKDSQGRIGLKFLDVDKDTQNRLIELCAELRTQPLAKLQLEGAGRTRPLVDSSGPQGGARPASPTAGPPSPPSRSPTAPGEPRTASQPGQAGFPAVGEQVRHERDRRRVPRYISDLRTRLSDLATGASWSLTLITLSILGGCAEGSGLPQPGLKCELTADWEGRTLRLEAEVVWRGKDQIGFKFASPGAEAEKLLREICSNLRLQPLAPFPEPG